LEWAQEHRGEESSSLLAELGLAGPSVFTAVEEHLGLKLESTKAPLEMIVIEGTTNPWSN
jgi:uncharacterized protein (TIGR03435 family)